MIILKPEKGYVIPVVYMNNEKLYYDTNVDMVRFDEKNREVNLKESNNTTFNEYDEVIRNKLFDDDFEDNYNNVITTILDNKEKSEEDSRGILVFEDDYLNNISIDENGACELNRARGNLRKAIEVEIEKVGKLVLDDNEKEISSKVSAKSVDVEVDDHKAEELDGNIVTDEARDDNGENCERDSLEIEKEDNVSNDK